MRKKKITKAILKKRDKRSKTIQFNKKLNCWKKGIIERDNSICQKCGKNLNGLNDKGKKRLKNPHHIISLESVKHRYPLLLEDLNNGILLCSQCHKFNNDSAHESGFEFTIWLMKNKTNQYIYLKDFLESQK